MKITSISRTKATEYLVQNGWNLQSSLDAYVVSHNNSLGRLCSFLLMKTKQSEIRAGMLEPDTTKASISREDAMVKSFMDITNVTETIARQFLKKHDWNLSVSVDDFMVCYPRYMSGAQQIFSCITVCVAE
jgi:hypothetical protein